MTLRGVLCCQALVVALVLTGRSTDLPGKGESIGGAHRVRQGPTSYPLTEEEYFSGLKTADDSTFRSLYEIPFLLLLSDSQRTAYLELESVGDRKAFIDWYWRATNPDPLLPSNDWLTAFLQRCIYVWRNFSIPQPPYFDDRGKYYIKYGRPAFRYQDSGGFKYVAFLRRDDPEASYTVLPNETWSYENVEPDFVVHFAREGNVYREIGSLTQVLVDRKRARQALLWGDLIKERASVAPVLSRAAMRVEEIETSLRHVAQSGHPGLLSNEVVSPHERIFEVVRENEKEIGRATREAPPVARDAIRAKNRLIFYDRIAQFQAPKGQTRVEVVLLAPVHKNLVRRWQAGGRETLSIEFATLLRDRAYAPVARAVSALRVPVTAGTQANAVGSLFFVAPPGSGDLTLQVEEVGKGQLGFRRQAFSVRDFRGDSLMISDVQLLAQADSLQHGQAVPILEKEGLTLSPYPYLQVRKSQPLYCYFEVYNLEQAGITSAYKVSYQVSSADQSRDVLETFTRWLGGSRDAAIRVAVDRPVSGDSSRELIALDLANLPNGRYRLEITVTSPSEPSQSATATKELLLVD